MLTCGMTELGADGAEINPTASDHPWTVVAVAPDGSWGVGHKPYIYQAIAEAVSNCKRVYTNGIGCGAQFEAIQVGWVIVIRCNGLNVIAPASTFAAAVQLAAKREELLRTKSGHDFPECLHIITVNPNGTTLPFVSEIPWTGPLISQKARPN
jgi:hypothetical protein